jgi:hypothetical protein
MSSVFKNSDMINKLPTDDNEISQKEESIVEMLYPTPSEVIKKLPQDTQKAWFHFKDIIIATVLFFLLNLPISDRLLQNIVKTENLYYKIIAKSLTFALLFFFITNFGLARNN